MGLTVKNKNSYGLDGNVADFFSLPIEENEVASKEYETLKWNIYSLELDEDIENDIINKIDSLDEIKDKEQRNKIIKEIEEFKKIYRIE